MENVNETEGSWVCSSKPLLARANRGNGFGLGALHVPLIALSQFIEAHDTDVSIGV